MNRRFVTSATIALVILILFDVGGEIATHHFATTHGAAHAAPHGTTHSASHAAGATTATGPHRGGVLLLHANPKLVYTGGLELCGSSDLENCKSAAVRTDVDEAVAIHVLAAFDETATPRLSGIVFGIDRDQNVEILDWKRCGDFELATLDWPSRGSGTAITWQTSQSSHITEVYWFAARAYGGPGQLWLTAHPVQGAYFADDVAPTRLDAVSQLGAFGFGMDGTAPCPTPVIPEGACCFADGSCGIYTVGACAAADGLFIRDAEPCAPNPCPQPGACCSEDGSCRLVQPEACDEEFDPNASCTPNPCQQLGACCFDDGSCHTFFESVCIDCGGIYEGDNTVCNPLPCPQRGVCCYDDGSCGRVVERVCTEAGGIFAGEKIECDERPCPEPGACCFPQGECELRLADNCDEQFLGDGSTCDPNSCAQPPMGACCFVDGTCSIRSEFRCASEGGFYRGDNELCGADLCPESLGACCIDQECQILNPIECATVGGLYMGDDTSCETAQCGLCRSKIVAGLSGSSSESRSVEGSVEESAARPAQPRPGEPNDSGGCGILITNFDGTYENAYAWEGRCVAPPDFGAFAEGYLAGESHVCSVLLDLTQVGNQNGQLLDAYVWEDLGGLPGAVDAIEVGVDPGPIATWPSVSRHTIPIYACPTTETIWVGYWAEWPGQSAGWYVGADLDGFGGVPVTKATPAAGVVDGWQPVSDLFGPTRALGIGLELGPQCQRVPVEKTTWGKIKHLFREPARGARRE